MTHSTARLPEPWMLSSRRTDPNAVHMGASTFALIGTPSCAGDNGGHELRRAERFPTPRGHLNRAAWSEQAHRLRRISGDCSMALSSSRPGAPERFAPSISSSSSSVKPRWSFPPRGSRPQTHEPPASSSVCSRWTTASRRSTAVFGTLSPHTEAAWAGFHAPRSEPFFRSGLARHERLAQ